MGHAALLAVVCRPFASVPRGITTVAVRALPERQVWKMDLPPAFSGHMAARRSVLTAAHRRLSGGCRLGAGRLQTPRFESDGGSP
jgi:hypothetical protein